MTIEELISQFKKKVQNKYSDIYISFQYLAESDYYKIWHNRPDLDDDNDFNKWTAELLIEMFDSSGIMNVLFTYSYSKSIEVSKYASSYSLISKVSYDMSTTLTTSLEYNDTLVKTSVDNINKYFQINKFDDSMNKNNVQIESRCAIEIHQVYNNYCTNDDKGVAA